LDSKEPINKKVEALIGHIQINDVKLLQRDLERHAIDRQRIEAIEHQDEEEAELEEIQVVTSYHRVEGWWGGRSIRISGSSTRCPSRIFAIHEG
jgi:hypothetical protein